MFRKKVKQKIAPGHAAMVLARKPLEEAQTLLFTKGLAREQVEASSLLLMIVWDECAGNEEKVQAELERAFSHGDRYTRHLLCDVF